MGGADALLARAQADFDRGNYRWVVEVLNHLVFAEPQNLQARALAADAMEQLGYQSESATWRNSYLLGARELRDGPPRSAQATTGIITAEVVAAVPLEMFLDVLAIRVNGPKAQDMKLRFDWTLTDDGSCRKVTLVNGVLNHSVGSHGDSAQASIHLSRGQLATIARKGLTLIEAGDQGLIEVKGDAALFNAFLQVLDSFKPMFAVLEP
jgi:alkyl sulfatase BDS1-like metallo-beta-lactamase superfamily hydrolase